LKLCSGRLTLANPNHLDPFAGRIDGPGIDERQVQHGDQRLEEDRKVPGGFASAQMAGSLKADQMPTQFRR
jgi:hypothetical protein